MTASSPQLNTLPGGVAAALVVAGLLYGAACAFLWSAQRQLIFLPQPVVTRTPSDVGLEFRDVNIALGKGSFLDAWWLPGDPDDDARAVVLYLHGNDGNLGQEVDRLRALHRFTLPILAIDYRGYGRSGGPSPSEAQVYEDATAAWDYLVQTRRVPPNRIVIYGHSLGAAVATELALRRRAACGVVLESAFTSMSEMARLAYPWIPVDSLLTERFDTLNKMLLLDLPVVFVHGADDDEVPSTMSERLYRAARGVKQLLIVKHAGHEQAMPSAGESMARAMSDLAQHCGGQ